MRTQLALALASSLLICPALAQTEAPEPATADVQADLPDGFAVIDRYNEAIGGIEANEAVKTIHMVGTFSMPAMNLSGTIDMKLQAPASRLITIDIEGIGVVFQGTDGKVAWGTQMPGTPPVLLDEKQTKIQIEDANFHAELYPREKYTSAENTGTMTSSDREHYKIKLASKAGAYSFALYDVETGLLHMVIMYDTPEYAMSTSSAEYSDYREIRDGILMPFELSLMSGNMAQNIKFETITFDEEFEEGTFDAPGAL